MIGKGYSVQSAQLEMNMVAEGYYASACIQHYMRKHQIALPICEAVYQILYQHKSAATIISQLAEKLS
ncbi:Glycerol-3-phosphate dehydrogenase [NAD(P)+] [compost metagenome]